MPRPVRMPPLGATSNELRILQWLKEVGSTVEQGEPLLEVETDKATLEVEAAVSGTLLAVLHGAGETVAVGEVLGFVGAPGEEVPAVEPPAKRQAVPVARKLAQEHGIDLASVRGSGPGGRIEKQDVLALVDTAAGTELSRHRRALADRLTRSVQTIPQFSAAVDVDMSSAAAHLERARAAGLAGATYTHLLLRATAHALREHPGLNRVWVSDGPRLRALERADVGLAVAGDETLLVQTISEPDAVELPALVELTERAQRLAQEGKVTGGPVAITVSNLGMLGVDRFSAIVDPDQTAILAVGAVTERVSAGGGEVRIGPWVELTLTVDHRVVDGVLAARFLAAIRSTLESDRPLGG
ncbi:MAG TPA: dihydrolipoamide acetyltransferase family protein [Gaiellaceae bacterium]|nr:dihydrolipoamide acetyltransferase family protein [Gaiellaceae bacterium]